MQPKLKRYNFNLLAHYTVSDAFEPFIEAKFNRLETLGNNAGPSFIQGTFGQYDFRERVRLDNPFLSPAERTQIATLITNSGCNTSLTAPSAAARSAVQGQGIGGALNGADLAAIADGSYRFVVARQLLDAGIRDEEIRRNTFRVVTGARGTFNDDWSYEVSLNYGKFKEKKTTYGYLDSQRFMLSLDSTRDRPKRRREWQYRLPLAGDPASAVGYDRGAFSTGSRENAGQAARLAADIAACVPYNPFGATDNSAAVDYFSYNAHADASLRQFVASGYVSGDSEPVVRTAGRSRSLRGRRRVPQGKGRLHRRSVRQ